MSNIMSSIYNMRLLDDLARKDTSVHRLNPLVKLLTTLVYLTVVVSFGRYAVGSLLPFLFYPVIIFAFAELPFMPILKRILVVEPFIIGIGILNPLFDDASVTVGSFEIARGWITFISIIVKCSLTITAAILLIATTGMDRLAAALRILKVPKLFVQQLLLTYRYISVLMEEVARTLRAYFLRAPKQKGIQRNVWGSLAGQLIMRTYDRGQRIYEAMRLRGFTGEYPDTDKTMFTFMDFVYLFGWCSFFLLARFCDIPNVLGSLFTGVIK